MKILIGKKIGMSRIFDKDGKTVPVTVIESKPCIITYIKTEEKDGYNAVQIGYGNNKRLNKPTTGHLKKSNAKSKCLIECKNLGKELKVGDKLSLDQFKVRDKVIISGISKGKGFAGVIKRHGFSLGPASHGSGHHRAPGAIGGAYPQRVVKGKKMAGRMGGQSVTISGLEVINIISDKNLIAVKGAIPGANGTVVKIKGE